MKINHLLKKIVLTTSLLLSGVAIASDWTPSGPITLKIGFGPGGATDVIGRVIASAIETNNGWDVIVENKPGGGGVAMLSGLARDKADGTKIGLGVTMATLMNIATRGDSLPFNLDSFDYIGTVVTSPLAVIARADAPFNTFAEFIEQSKANGGYLVGFDGGPQKLIINAINADTGADIVTVSHKSGSEQIQSLLGGQIQAGFGAGAHIEYLKSGDLKMLAVATNVRQPYSPETSSLIEQGFNYSLNPYFYLTAPKGLPENVKAALSAALEEALKSEAVIELIENTMKTEAQNLGPAGTEAELKNSLAMMTKLVADSK
ncbi:tripartite tricarboxylate transporter substrate binding protein [Reinekea marinisedimentorum]|uniref:Tripartite-type tricarboxylate transporter receptor subunit TctC n=1 Tax=Reinekea marinisedimentorum TaxID=230495 RepID=A0A4R3I1C3_9GAMM|nr:tripartite tricarboxylate transporter substrate binding protein [Reinekea marinisedimentorum]TCS38803.1 tripartite-type tricarboxylate transporter receptor subunit TctC [Reinekea marinisedimentorum]